MIVVDLLKKASKNTLIYALGGVGGRIIGFFLIPLYTRYLTPGDYGTIELLDLTGSVIGMFAGIGLGSALVRFYYDFSDQRDKNEVVSTAVLFMTAANAAFLGVLLASSRQISRIVFGTNSYASYFRLIFISLCLGILVQLLLSYLRAKQEAIRYTAYTVFQLILGLGLNVYLVAGRRMGIVGILYSGVITQAAVAGALAYETISQVKFRFSHTKLKGMLQFGAPLVPGGLAIFVLNFADRFFLQKFSSLSVVGTYALGYKLGMSMQALVSAPFFLFWFAYRYELAQKENAQQLFAEVFDYFALALIFLTLGLCLLSKEAVRVLAPPSYWAAARIVPVIAVAYLASAFYYFFQAGLGVTKQTKLQAYAVTVSACVCLALYYLLIPRYGADGGAWATLAAYGFLAALTYRLSQGAYPIPYRLQRTVKMLCAAAGVYAVSLLVPQHSHLFDITVNLILLMSFPFLLWITRVFFEDELTMIRRLFGMT